MTPFVSAMFRSAGGAPAGPTAWNPADKAADVTLTNSDRTASVAATAGRKVVRGTDSKATGKWYFEIFIDAASTPAEESIGLANTSATLNSYLGVNANSVGYFGNGAVYNSGVVTTYASYTNSDIIQVAFDGDTGQVWFGKNGTFNGDPASGTGQATTLSGPMFPAAGFYTTTASKTIAAVPTYSIPSGFSLWA